MNINTKLTIKPSPYDERDWFVSSIYENLSLPEKIDYSQILNPPRNQGEQGSCAAQSAACMKEWQEKKDIGYEGLMSPQFIYNNRENQESEGMHCRDVMKILSKKGSCFEDDYPYGKIEDPSLINSSVYQKASNFKIKNYAQINTINELKKAIYLNGPCLIAFPTYNYTNRMWIPQKGDKPLGGHAMTVVGYNAEGFIIRNSWGTNWGDNGYCIYPFYDWGSHWEIWTTIDDKSFYQENVINYLVKPDDLEKYAGEHILKDNIFININPSAEEICLNNFIYLWKSDLNCWQDIDYYLYTLNFRYSKSNLVVEEYYQDSLIKSFIFNLDYQQDSESDFGLITDLESNGEETDLESNVEDETKIESESCWDKFKALLRIK